jgi:hypothetical protein
VQQVSINRNLLVGLCVTLVASLMLCMFLLGRESGRRGTSEATTAAATPTTNSAPAAAPTAAGVETPAAPVDVAVDNRPPAAAAGEAPAAPRITYATPPADTTSTGATPGSTAVAPKPAAGSTIASRPRHAARSAGERAAIQAYLARMDEIGPGKFGDDPDSFAHDTLQSSMSGDFSSLDSLIAQAENSRSKVAALQPPQACAAYHHEALALLSASDDMLKRMRGALANNDVQAVTTLGADAAAMRARAESLDRQENDIKASLAAQ